MSLLTQEDRQAIAAAIEEAEKSTSGEIVFAVNEASATYRQATLQGSLAGMAIATAVYLALPIPHTIGLLLWAQLISFAGSYALFLHLPARRWFISRAELDARVNDAALMEFYRSGLYRTRESNAVLIYLSVFERRVVVLGDKGIHEKMGTQHWDEVRDHIIRGILTGSPREGIVAAVAACAAALATHFPYRNDDRNEISNDVIDRTAGDDPR